MNELDRYAVSLENMEVLRDQVEVQAREIERLHRDYDEACEDAMAVARQLAALKAKPSGAEELAVLREYRTAIRNFNDCHGVEDVTLEEAVVIERRAEARLEAAEKACHDFYAGRARLNQPASAGDERAAFDTWFARDVWNEGCYGNPDILRRQLWPCWQARAALSANHSEQFGQAAKFTLGDRVRKTKGSQWQGTVVGTYSTALTPEGYAVESGTELGSVQIYPAAALEACE